MGSLKSPRFAPGGKAAKQQIFRLPREYCTRNFPVPEDRYKINALNKSSWHLQELNVGWSVLLYSRESTQPHAISSLLPGENCRTAVPTARATVHAKAQPKLTSGVQHCVGGDETVRRVHARIEIDSFLVPA
jgi:hypothetical protein